LQGLKQPPLLGTIRIYREFDGLLGAGNRLHEVELGSHGVRRSKEQLLEEVKEGLMSVAANQSLPGELRLHSCLLLQHLSLEVPLCLFSVLSLMLLYYHPQLLWLILPPLTLLLIFDDTPSRPVAIWSTSAAIISVVIRGSRQ
jgi:hypothetical protein